MNRSMGVLGSAGSLLNARRKFQTAIRCIRGIIVNSTLCFSILTTIPSMTWYTHSHHRHTQRGQDCSACEQWRTPLLQAGKTHPFASNHPHYLTIPWNRWTRPSLPQVNTSSWSGVYANTDNFAPGTKEPPSEFQLSLIPDHSIPILHHDV